MLKLANNERVSSVTILEDVTLHLISLSVVEKEALLLKMGNVEQIKGKSTLVPMLSIIAPAVKNITGPGIPENKSVLDILKAVENIDDIQAITEAITDHCSLTPDESKNSFSLSEQPTPDSAGSAEINAGVANEPVSITPAQTEVS